MKSSTIQTAFTAFISATTVSAAYLPTLQEAPTVQFDIQRKQHDTSISRSQRDKLRKRADKTLEIILDNQQTLYFANVSIGTPAQSLRLDIDTGSSDIWANSATSSLCQSSSESCSESGTYNANNSNTYKYVNSDFSIQYADGSYAIGDYGQDVLNANGMSVNDVVFGIGYRSTSSQGILGVGYAANEASVSGFNQQYDNFPLILVKQGVITTPAYSLWLNDLSASTGSVLFGGIDTSKFTGTLGTLPVIPENGIYREFIVSLTGLAVADQTIISSPVDVLLDSGSSLSYLPTAYAKAIFQIFKAKYNQQAQIYTVDCSYMNSDKTFAFNFGSMQITVPFDEMVFVDGTQNGEPICALGVMDAGGSTNVLGDTFLRSAYVVYDIGSNVIAMAQTNFNATGSSIQAITSGGVPSATSVSGAIATSSSNQTSDTQPSTTPISASSYIFPSFRTMFISLGLIAFGACSL